MKTLYLQLLLAIPILFASILTTTSEKLGTMSMFKTLQRQPRTISLFTHDLENSRPCLSILEYLKSHTTNRFDLELSTKFPTLDQVHYMNAINPMILRAQIPHLTKIMKLKSYDPLFGSQLSDCVTKGFWNKEAPLWVDWEKKALGTDLQSIKELLEKD